MEYCEQPPDGWSCTREKGQEGPCAAHPSSRGIDIEAVAWLRYRRSNTSEHPTWLAICDPFDEGAFPVYRHSTPQAKEKP